MKIYEVQLKDQDDEIVYRSLVPAIHVQDKVDTLLGMNDIGKLGGIVFVEKGDISDRYIQTFNTNPQMKGSSRIEVTRAKEED